MQFTGHYGNMDPKVNLTTVKLFIVALPFIFLIELAIAGMVNQSPAHQKKEGSIFPERIVQPEDFAASNWRKSITGGVLHLSGEQF